MKIRLLPFIVAGLFAGAAGAADPQTPGSASSPPSTYSGQTSFEQADTNKDGVITSAEAKKDATLNRMFKQLDTDRDGKVTQNEFDAGAGGSMGRPSR